MNEAIRKEVIQLGRRAHDLTESAYREDPATRGDPGWGEKQRILLADMALHLLQTALTEGEFPTNELRRNLYAILTVSDQFLPGCELKVGANGLLDASPDVI